MKILLVEDDEKTGNYLTKGLSSAGHVVDWVRDGRNGLSAGLDASHDVMVVDRKREFLRTF
jgi:two-component system OmpR family response regulator